MRSHRRWRHLSVVALAVSVALVASSCGGSSQPAAAHDTLTPGGGVPLPAQGVYFGASAGQTEERAQQAFEQLVALTGSNLSLHRTYQQWDSPAISPATRWDGEHGVLPSVSVKPPSNWAEVAGGSLDADIAAQADAWKAWGKPALLTFHHEPENDRRDDGSPQDYVNAWRHYVQVFRDRGVTNVSFAWIMMATSFGGAASKAERFYPGDEWVDWLGVDGYNWYGCRKAPWLSFADVMSAFRTWAATKHPTKPIVVAETGTEEGVTAGAKGQWIQDMLTTVKGWPQVKGIAYFDISMDGCDWPVTSSPSSLDGWRSVAADPWTLDSVPGS